MANKDNTKRSKMAHVIHLRVLSECYLMNTKMTGFRWFSKSLHPCALDEIILRIRRVNTRFALFYRLV